ncbi:MULTISPECIES: N-acetylmuramoyl-L-alanine amidase [unclassified Streptomyces]|uniref:N-acetylmuramoyl-L-alanine amidase n=1 Tax=unclassified Streptomyces TaxID=2593676 RepID=UPI000DB9204C|nr:N-acetylmuramoyl-L-alanine amidase [Streptomyces sp. PsTaAH-130]MYU08472.1 N-acetylmuramoyl-L-alanine amidase [Streptomyces sp. SID8366]MYU63812.1 N-acetylmuramoyl-L-alanine amidase [Streptomyces sp. SID69]RAJ62857.1 N-acetylmuramoyl-L-alanine amidase [Streptomyces sp. PsTaAH-130]
MSYTGPESEPPKQRRSWRVPIVVAGGALVAGGLVGWGAYAAGGGAGEDAAKPAGRSAPAAAPGADDKAAAPLAGKVVVIDPGHNVDNFRHPAEINRQVDVGNGRKECDTTGTSTNDGYPEARFTLDVAHRLRALLERQGATVRLTHDEKGPEWGPCVDERAAIGNKAHADAAISIHADGAPAGDRGFHVILPGAVHAGGADTRPIVGPSRALGERIASDFRRVTGEPPSNYIGHGTALDTRTDLGGLNLSTVPKVFIECGNMRDTKDAALLTSGTWRQKAAQGMSEGIVSFLRGS